MTLKEIIKDLSKRQELARHVHRRERESKHPDIRAKSEAWGKIVGYGRALTLLDKLKIE